MKIAHHKSVPYWHPSGIENWYSFVAHEEKASEEQLLMGGEFDSGIPTLTPPLVVY